jgi:hypothetical protein
MIHSWPGQWLANRCGMLHMGCLSVLIGQILILAGQYALLLWYGYSTMIDPSLPGTEWWAEWAGRHSPASYSPN